MMGLTWYVLGVLTAVSAYVLYEYSQKHKLDWIAWTGLVLGIVLITMAMLG